MKRFLQVSLVLVCGLLLANVSQARCYVCEGVVNQRCANVDPWETGQEDCLWLDEPFPWPDVCGLGGTFCTELTVGGGGGGGGGAGGGSTACNTSGFCPAECFSCGGGGGGRPAI